MRRLARSCRGLRARAASDLGPDADAGLRGPRTGRRGGGGGRTHFDQRGTVLRTEPRRIGVDPLAPGATAVAQSRYRLRPSALAL